MFYGAIDLLTSFLTENSGVIMPVVTNKVIYDNLTIKEPVQVRMKVDKNELINGKNYVGTTVAGKTIKMVAWSTILTMCPEDNPECTTPSKAIEIVVVCDGSKYVLQSIFGTYYVSPQAMFVYDLFDVGKETDVVVDVYFRSSRITVVANNSVVIDTDMMKKGVIKQIAGNNRGIATDNTEVDLHLQHTVDVFKLVDVSQSLSIVLPLVAIGAVLGSIFGIFKYIK